MAGVGGIAGVSRVAKAAPDGYQFVVGNVGTHAQNQYLFAYPPYDAAAESVPAALLADLVMLVAVRADLPIDDLHDFIAHLHANAAHMQYASAGFGPPSHLDCPLLNSTLGVDVRHVPYRGGGELLVGKVRLLLLQRRGHQTSHSGWAAEGTGCVFTHAAVKSAQCRHGAGTRFDKLRGVKLDGLVLASGDTGTHCGPAQCCGRDGAHDQVLQAKLRALGAEPAAPDRNTQERLTSFLARERDKWGTVIRKSNIRLE
jgi:tripartite-type tricarboxylate transporter receptor subunit TctC